MFLACHGVNICICTAGRLGQRAGRGGQNEALESSMAEDLPCSPSKAPPGFPHPSALAPLPRLKTTGQTASAANTALQRHCVELIEASLHMGKGSMPKMPLLFLAAAMA